MTDKQFIEAIYELAFGNDAIRCQNCQKDINKFDWFIEKGKYSKF